MALKPAAKNVLIVLIILIVCGGAYYYFNNAPAGETPVTKAIQTITGSSENPAAAVSTEPPTMQNVAPQNLDLGIKTETPVQPTPVDPPVVTSPAKVKPNKVERKPPVAPTTVRQETPKRVVDPFSSVGNL